MHRTDAARNVANLFVDKDIGAGTRGTVVDADWLNAVQEELCNFIEDLGGTLVKGTNTQLLTTLMSASWALAGSALQSILKGGSGGLDIGTSIAADLRVLLNSVAQWTFRESDGALVSNSKQITGLPSPAAASDGTNKSYVDAGAILCAGHVQSDGTILQSKGPLSFSLNGHATGIYDFTVAGLTTDAIFGATRIGTATSWERTIVGQPSSNNMRILTFTGAAVADAEFCFWIYAL
jgi:hypothetical protein